jgi:hypothetical protein
LRISGRQRAFWRYEIGHSTAWWRDTIRGVEKLQCHLDALIGFVRNDKHHLPWSKILLVEDLDITRQMVNGKYVSFVPRRALSTPSEYTARFEELMNGGFSWINMNAAGVISDTLFVIIELPNYCITEARDKASVNLSGAPIFELGGALLHE